MARRAFKRLLENPDETEHVFVLIRALSGRSFERLMRRVRKDPMGAQIIRERRNLMPLLTNREYLLGLPQETLGHQYCRFTLAEQISAEGLADASLVMRGAEDKPLRNEDFDAEAFGERLRDMHDLWHVVTGYSRDILGELALLALDLVPPFAAKTGQVIAEALVAFVLPVVLDPHPGQESAVLEILQLFRQAEVHVDR